MNERHGVGAQLTEDKYGKWMARLDVATLLLTVIRLWIRA